jgi:multidrug efflux pump subunit AcrB
MGIVRFALRYQHTFYVLALLMVFLGGSAIIATPKDIFPSINTPVVTVIWQYTGLTPEEMDQRVTTYSEYAISTSVGNVRNIESQTLSGISVEKIFFQPNVNVDLAISQIVSATNFIRALMPAGIQSPVIVQFNASSEPVLQLSLSSDRLNEQQLYDYGIYQMRQALAPIPGITLPTPYGGKYRQIMVDLDPARIIQTLRQRLAADFPDVLFYFQPADLVTQVLNFGVPTQVDVQVQGRDRENNKRIAALLRQRIGDIPGIVDAHVQQELDAPEMSYTIDRTRAQELGLNMQEVANDLNISLSSSEQISPNFWTDPKTGIPYYFAVQTPEYRISDKAQLDNTPVASSSNPDGIPIPNVLGNIAAAKRVAVQSVYNQSNIQAVYDVYGSVEHRDLGGVAADIQKIVNAVSPQLKPGNHIVVRGQIQSMHSAFGNLTIGLLFAAVFVYMLMVVNYQSFLEPLAVVLALPGAGAGILLMLFVTGTTISVPSLMGSIMAIDVASANSILLVTFARELRQTGMSAFQAALSAGTTRLRPVLMTAAAMIVGMTPMAIGGPGEEQNAVLARAVIGGVVVGTITTLLFVPYLYSVIGRFDRQQAELPAALTAQGAVS